MNIIIYDLEATCWNGHQLRRRQEIIEIGAVMLNPLGEFLGDFQQFIRPIENPSLSAFCQDLTNISQENVDRANYFEDVAVTFQDWMGENYLLCSWGEKDIPLLAGDCEKHDLDVDWLYPNIDMKAQYHQFKRLNKKQGLQKTLKREEIEFEGEAHRALTDAQNTAKLFLRYLDEWQY